MKEKLLLLLLFIIISAHAQNTLKLPDLGNPSDQVLSPDEELIYRKSIRQQMYQYNFMMDDPVVTDYVHHLGYRLVPFSEDPQQNFEFHLIPADVINASAYPGGLVVIYSGLLLETDNESELAGVVAHEIAHVTQRHISRMMAKQKKSIAPLLLGMVAAVAAAQSSSSGDAPIAIAASMQALQAQLQINFTRYHEYEADRVGISTLYASGYDPRGMATFFEKLMQKHRGDPRYQLPEYLSTHPLSVHRVTEAKNRLKNYQVKESQTTGLYPFIKERVRVLTATESDDLKSFYQKSMNLEPSKPEMQYGLALHLYHQNKFDEAKTVLSQLKAPPVVQPIVSVLSVKIAHQLNPKKSLDDVKALVDRYPQNDVVKALMTQMLIKKTDLDSAGLAIDLLRNLLIEHESNPTYHDWLSIAYYNALKPVDSGLSLAKKEHFLGRNYRAVRILKNLKKQQLDYYQLAEIDAMIAQWESLITEDEYNQESQADRRAL